MSPPLSHSSCLELAAFLPPAVPEIVTNQLLSQLTAAWKSLATYRNMLLGGP